MEIRSLDAADAFTTADRSTIREVIGPRTTPPGAQSLTEATLEAGQATQRHYHATSEEIYFLLEGSGEMEVDGERAHVEAGDAVLIPPGAWHQIRADDARLRFLCCCAPPYSDADTFFA
ncbi:MAG TPA: cupin domain-containing protein [Gaiellaceae bacterium]